MFRLRQRTRRQLCRAGFVLVCLAPLAALVVWGAHTRTRSYVRQHERELRQSLGLKTRIASLTHPRPGVARYRDLELSDPETGYALVRCEQIEVRSRPLGKATDLDLVVHGLTLQPGGLAACYALADQLLRHEHNEGDVNVSLSIDDITFLDPDEACDLERVTGSLRSDPFAGEARLSFTLTADENAPREDAGKPTERVLLGITRNREQVPPVEEIVLHTGNHLIPFAWLAALGADLPALPASGFAGSLWARPSEAGGQVAIERGTVSGINLAVLASYCGHSITGQANVYIATAHAAAGKLIALRARIEGGPGQVPRALLASLVNSLGCTASATAPSAGESVPYDRLALEIAIDSSGQVEINSENTGGRTPLLTGQDRRPLLMGPAEPQSTAALVRALAGNDAPAVPATPHAARLLGWLPLPSSIKAGAPRNPARPDTAARPANRAQPSSGTPRDLR